VQFLTVGLAVQFLTALEFLERQPGALGVAELAEEARYRLQVLLM